MENGNQFGHGGHLDPLGKDCSDHRPSNHKRGQKLKIDRSFGVKGELDESCDNGESHTEDAIEVSLAGAFLLR